VAAIDLEKTKQLLTTNLRRVPLLNGPSAKCIVNFLEGHVEAVDKLHFVFRRISQRAMKIFHEYFRAETTTLQQLLIDGHLGNAKGRDMGENSKNTNIYQNSTETVLLVTATD
jgi:hypothetical protein